MAEIDYTTTAGAKEGGVFQPALAVSEGAPNEKPVIEEMYERRISKCFEERNILNSHDPSLGVVCQEGKVVSPKSGRFAISEAGIGFLA